MSEELIESKTSKTPKTSTIEETEQIQQIKQSQVLTQDFIAEYLSKSSSSLKQFERTEILLKEEIHILQKSHVVVAGLGGVGSFALENLIRAGVGFLTIIDHDTVDITNINRQLPALLNNVGQHKAQIMLERCQAINPQCRIRVIQDFLTPENIVPLLLEHENAQKMPPIDYVLDCIDTVNSKVNLIAQCYEKGIKVASSMGAGNKQDPSRIKIADIRHTEVCHLARVIRQRLKRLGIHKDVMTVYSDEPPSDPLPPVENHTGDGRARATNGTISYMPPLFGMLLAGSVIQQLLGHHLKNVKK